MLLGLTITSLVILMSYTVAVCIKFGIPTTLSESYYFIYKKYLFTLVMWLSGFLILPPIMEMTGGDTQIIPFLSIIGIMIVGAAPKYKEQERTLHIIGATMAGFFSQLWIILYAYPWTLLTWFILIIWAIGILIESRLVEWSEELDKRKWFFWAEMLAFINLYLNIIFKAL